MTDAKHDLEGELRSIRVRLRILYAKCHGESQLAKVHKKLVRNFRAAAKTEYWRALGTIRQTKFENSMLQGGLVERNRSKF